MKWVAELFEEPEQAITPDTRRISIAAWDSLGVLTLIAALDEKFGIPVSDADIQGMNSVGDVLEYSSKKRETRLRQVLVRFIFVDEILELVPGKYIKASKTIGPDEDFFRDHFPGFPVVPGVLLTEMMAQAAGKCLDAETPRARKSHAGTDQGSQFSRMGPAREDSHHPV